MSEDPREGEGRWSRYRPGGKEFTSESEVLRKCTKCGHFECPFCRIWCDTFIGHEDDPSIEEGDHEMCCDGECTYDREPDPRLDAFLGAHEGRTLGEREDGAVLAYEEPPLTPKELAEQAAQKARDEAERLHKRTRRAMREVLSKTVKAALKAMGKDGTGIYLVVDFGEKGVMSAILKDDQDPTALDRLGKKVADDWTAPPLSDAQPSNTVVVPMEERITDSVAPPASPMKTDDPLKPACDAAIASAKDDEAKVEALIEHARAWVKDPEKNGGLEWLQDMGADALAALFTVIDREPDAPEFHDVDGA